MNVKKAFMREKERKTHEAMNAIRDYRRAQWQKKVADAMEQFEVAGISQTHDEMVRKIEETTAVNEARMEMALGNVDQQQFKIEEEAENLRAANWSSSSRRKWAYAPAGVRAPRPKRPSAERKQREPRNPRRRSWPIKIEKGGWIAHLCSSGLGLVGYSLEQIRPHQPVGSLFGKNGARRRRWIHPSRCRAAAIKETNEVRVRVNIWVGCVGGLVANGGLDTAAGSIYDKKGLKVSFKIIDDWTEGAAALATNNVDIMLTTADVWAKDFAQFQDKGVNARAVYMVDWSRGADGVIGKQGINSIEDLAGKTVAFAPYTPSHFLLWNGLKSSGLSTEQRNEIFTKAVHTKDGIEPATLFAQQKVDAAVAWDPDMSDAVAKRPGSKKIYDTRIANRLIADILVVSDRFAANSPQTLRQVHPGLAGRRGVHPASSRFARLHPDRHHQGLQHSRRPCQDHAGGRAAGRLCRQPGVLRHAGLGFRLRQHFQDGRRRCTASCG